MAEEKPVSVLGTKPLKEKKTLGLTRIIEYKELLQLRYPSPKGSF